MGARVYWRYQLTEKEANKTIRSIREPGVNEYAFDCRSGPEGHVDGVNCGIHSSKAG